MKAQPLKHATIDISFRSDMELANILKTVQKELLHSVRDFTGSASGHKFTIRKGAKQDMRVEEINGNTCLVIQSKINQI